MKILMISAALLILSMAVYAAYLWNKVYRQTQQIKTAQNERRRKLDESMDLIAMAVEQGQCNLSEGVLRLKSLAEAAELDFSIYPNMNKLYETVADMPILEARKQLKRNERMKLDLIRESCEAELEQDIVREAGQLRKTLKKQLQD